METQEITTGTDAGITELFNLYETNDSIEVRRAALTRAAELVLVENKRITCANLYDLQELMKDIMRDNILTRKIEILFFSGQVLVEVK